MRNPPTKLQWTFALAVATLLLVPGCDGDSPVAPTLPEGDVPWVELLKSPTSGLDTFRRAVVRGQAAFASVWEEIGTDEELPTVNFEVDMVLVVASGEQPNGCYDLEVVAATSDGTDLTVRVEETTPTADCVCTAEVVQPVQVVRLPRADEVFFQNITIATCAA